VAVATHLADKSALARIGDEAVARRLGPMIEAGLVGTCGVIELRGPVLGSLTCRVRANEPRPGAGL
jgi:hypothetical protein